MEKLTPAQKKRLAAQVQALDPKGEIVSLTPNAEFTGGVIGYNKESGIILNETISRLKDEEYVRAWLVVRLVKVFRYPADSIELEHTYAAGRPSPTRAQIDIRIHDKRGKKAGVFILIEAKRPDDYDAYATLVDGQLFATGRDEVSRGLRYAVWHSVEFHGDEPRDKCIIIDFRKFTEHREWIEAGEPGHNLELPVEYGTVRKIKYVKGKTDLRNDLTKEELARLQKDFHNRLWGGAKMGDTDVFNNLIKMFIAKIYDEKVTVKGNAYRFQVELKDGVPESAEEIVAKVNQLYQDALRHYFKYDDEAIQQARINKEKFKPEKVAYVFEKLEPISILDNQCDDDVLGVFFEGIVRTGFKQEKGQFFTHVNIVRFILHALEIDSLAVDFINGVSPQLPYVVDSSCGSGSFLIEAMKRITQAVLQPRSDCRVRESDLTDEFVDKRFRPEAKNKNAHNAWAELYIYGIEDNEDLALATKVNMILHGDGNANIHKADGLASFAKYSRDRLKSSRQPVNEAYPCTVNEQFDIVVGNPPFSLKEDPRTLAEYGGRFLYAGKKNSENLFIERWYQLLKPGGRLGVVLPDSVFDTNENLYIRLFLYRFFFINAVVSLPQVAFQPYTPTKTSLLFAVKKNEREVEVWDKAWREAANEYGKLRRSEIIKAVLTNDRLRSTLIDMANRAEVEWYPVANLLAATSLPVAVRAALVDACADSAGQKKKLAKLLEDFDAFTASDPLADFTAAAEKDVRKTLARLLRDKAPTASAKLSLRDLLEAAYDDLVAAADLNHTEDPRGENYCNAWWCFAEVTAHKDFDYPIFFAEAGHVGYKRTTRHPEGIEQPNDLFGTDADGNVVIDTENPKTILDHLRSKRLFFFEGLSLDDAAQVRSFHRQHSASATGFSLRFSARFMHPKFALLRRESLTAERTFPLKLLCSRAITRGVQPEYDETEIRAVKTGTLRNGELDWSEAQTVSEACFEASKFRAAVRHNDMLVSSTGVGSLGKIDLYNLDTPALADGHIAIVRLRAGSHEPALLVHLMRQRVVQWQIEQGLTGSTNQIDIYPEQIEALRIPRLDAKKRTALLKTIEVIEREIATARTALRQPDDIINETLCAEFDYPLREHRERVRERQFARTLGTLASGFTLRGSAKSHHPDFELTDAFFARVPHERVKAFVAVPIRLGATATKGDFIEDGAAYYVHPGATKRQAVIPLEDCHEVTQEFYDATQRRFGLRSGDVVINRSGEALGKVAIWESDEPAVASDFTMRVRFNDRMNARFAWLFFRSVMFQPQIERELRGSSVPNIFPPEVERMHVVTCDRDRQNALAIQITADLDARASQLSSIEAKRREVADLIEEAIRDP